MFPPQPSLMVINVQREIKPSKVVFPTLSFPLRSVEFLSYPQTQQGSPGDGDLHWEKTHTSLGNHDEDTQFARKCHRDNVGVFM